MTTLVRYRYDNFATRPGVPADLPDIMALIRGLADYVNRLDQFVASEDMLEKWIFHEHKAEVVIGVADGDPVGFAIFYTSFSTFLGKPGLHLEDLFIIPKARGNGYGKQLLKYLAKEAASRDYARLEWSCRDWNRPAINFYLSLGAEPQDDSTVYRLDGEPLAKLAAEA